MNIRLALLLATMLSVAALEAGAQSQAQLPKAPMTPERAITSLKAHLLKDATYAENLRKGCVVFDADTSNPEYLLVSVFEDHSKGCGGDPMIAHHLDDFRVHMDGTIEWYCVYEDIWVPYQVYTATNGMGCNQQANAP